VTADGVLTRPDVEVIKRSAGRRLLWLAVLVVVLLVIVVASVIFGVRAVSLDNALAALSGGTATAEQAAAAGRLPRTVLGLLAGMSLAIAGGAMQAVTRNPLADPGIFGVLSGASLAVVIGLAFFDLSHPYAQLLIAVLGAGVAAGFVYGVGSLGRGGATPLKLALAGAATSAACSSLVSAILLPRTGIRATTRSPGSRSRGAGRAPMTVMFSPLWTSTRLRMGLPIHVLRCTRHPLCPRSLPSSMRFCRTPPKTRRSLLKWRTSRVSACAT